MFKKKRYAPISSSVTRAVETEIATLSGSSSIFTLSPRVYTGLPASGSAA
jgi:hypothetical protein